MAGKVSRFLLLQNTILIKMIKEIKRKWNQHKCTSSPQNKDYWRNCWAFLELQATRKTIQTDAVLGYKTSPLVCFYGIFIWTVCFAAANVTGKQSWWQRCSGWCSPPQLMGTEILSPRSCRNAAAKEAGSESPKRSPLIQPGGFIHLQEVGTQSTLTWEAPCTSSLASWATMPGFMLGFSFHQLKSEMC